MTNATQNTTTDPTWTADDFDRGDQIAFEVWRATESSSRRLVATVVGKGPLPETLIAMIHDLGDYNESHSDRYNYPGAPQGCALVPVADVSLVKSAGKVGR